MDIFFVNLAIGSYLLAFLLFLSCSNSLAKAGIRLADKILKAGFIFNTIFVIARWHASGRPPFANMYEALILFAWSMAFVYIVFEFVYKVKLPGAPVSFLVLFTIAATLFLDNTISPLIPALQSKWISVHVVTYFIGYGALSISFAMSLLYLFVCRKNSLTSAQGLSLDIWSYRLIAFAFPFLTIGMTTGSVWANVAWGTYWGWDPKETCSLITWLVYALYLHLRILRGWKDKKAAYLSIIGFLATLFTFVGVNFILSGLHSYS